MAARAIRQHTELSETRSNILRPEHELFAASVALGMGYRKSARRAGFHEDHGFRLMQRPAIRDRVEVLQSAPVEERIQAEVMAGLHILYNRVVYGDLDSGGRANLRLQERLARTLAKLSGSTGREKQVAKVGVGLRFSRADLDAAIAGDLV